MGWPFERFHNRAVESSDALSVSVRPLTVKGGKVTDLRQMSLDRERVGCHESSSYT
jgi:hypothetical protein